MTFLVMIMAFRILPGQINRCFQVANFSLYFSSSTFLLWCDDVTPNTWFSGFGQAGPGPCFKIENSNFMLVVLERRRSVKSVIIDMKVSFCMHDKGIKKGYE